MEGILTEFRMKVKYGMQYYMLGVVWPSILIHGFGSLTRSSGGISTGDLNKWINKYIKCVCQVHKLTRKC